MRLFIAIELPPDVRDHLIQVREAIRDRIAPASFTRDDNLHITLKFLGEVDDRRLVQLTDSLKLVRAGGPIDAFAERVECFPPRGPVRIVAAGFAGSIAGVRALHDSIEQRCLHLGFEREMRQYRPHVTLARARPILAPAMRDRVAEATGSCWPGPAFSVHEFALFESRLRPQGAEYAIAARFSLPSA